MSDETPCASIVLASGSPRRRELLGALGLSFRVLVSDAAEDTLPNESPAELVTRLSQAKAEAARDVRPNEIVIAADTIVVLDDDILGKPRSDAEATAMLARLRNRQHLVYSGLAITAADAERRSLQVAVTPVTMRAYCDAEIAAYVASGDPRDKAGAYAIQSTSLNPIADIDGCYANVMGLPLCHLYRVLRAWGCAVPVHPFRGCPQAVRAGCPWAADILYASRTDNDPTHCK